jgi:hypothetical protein
MNANPDKDDELMSEIAVGRIAANYIRLFAFVCLIGPRPLLPTIESRAGLTYLIGLRSASPCGRGNRFSMIQNQRSASRQRTAEVPAIYNSAALVSVVAASRSAMFAITTRCCPA